MKSFVEQESSGKVSSLKTRLVKDLGCSGDDNLDLLEKFVIKYNLEQTGFEYQKHFNTEYELFGSEAALYRLIKLPIQIFLAAIRILSFGKVKADQVMVTFFEEGRPVSDMTIGDMVTWYLEKDYKLREDVKYVIDNAHNF